MTIAWDKYLIFDVETYNSRQKFYSKEVSPYDGDRIFAYAYCYMSDPNNITVVRGDMDRLQNLINSAERIVAHNYKYEYAVLKTNNINIPDHIEWHDTMTLSQLLQNDRFSHALDSVIADYVPPSILNNWKRVDDEVSKEAKANGGYHKVNKRLMRQYQINDIMRTACLFKLFYPKVYENKRLHETYRIEIDVIKVTESMERHGIMLHIDNCNELIAWLHNELNDIRDEVFSLYGEYINLNSAPQVQNLLFNKLGMTPIIINEKSGEPSVDKGVLLKLKELYNEPILDLIIKQRSYKNGIATIKSYIKLADENGYIHPSILTNHADTARQSCRKPNLQNVAKSKAQDNPYPVPARKCFTKPRNRVFYFVDYAGIEMRLGAFDANEKEILDIIANDGDVHHPTSELFFGSEYTKEERGAAKSTGFGILYGAGAFRLAQTLNRDINEVKTMLDKYSMRFPNLFNYASNSIKEAKETGGINTVFGRFLNVPRNQLYAAANYRIQHIAAMILKIAEINVYKLFMKKWTQCNLVIPIHDELVFETPVYKRSIEKEMLNDIKEAMVNIPHIGVKLDVEYKKSFTTWEDAVKYEY